jgi:hypothetical protein
VTALDGDRLLRRLERRAVVACLVLALGALVVRGGRPDVALGVLGGGVLAGASYWAIKGSVDRLISVVPRGSRSRRAAYVMGIGLVLLRYALLAFGAYVMIARLRLHAVGLVVGASSIVAAAAVDAVRATRS